ncbi:MAG: hypothetical protein HY075_02860 [Deltaproteobacteria bacterium]|nr:hypothetical protein [Deltaproteobacteria bacterium]
MAANVIKFQFKGFSPAPEFEAYANERLTSLVHTAPFGTTCVAEIELTPTGYKTVIKMTYGANPFHGTNIGSDLENSMQRCMGMVRSKTFKYRKDKLAQKNKPKPESAEQKADPLNGMKKKFYTG